MAKLFYTAIILVLLNQFGFCQDKVSKLFIEGGIEQNLLFPTDVNKYISAQLDLKGYDIMSGTSDIFYGISAHGGLNFITNQNFSLKGFGLLTIAPKYITIINEETESYLLWRIGIGAIVSYNIPITSVMSISPGVGVLGNIIGFEEISKTAVGARTQLAFIFVNNEKINFNFAVGYDINNAKTGTIPKELNMNSIYVSALISYKLN